MAEDTLGEAENPVVEAPGEADEAAPMDLGSDVRSGKEKPWTRAEKRIRQLVQEKKEALAAREAEKAAREALEQKLSALEARLDRAAAKESGPKGAFDVYSVEDLFALKTKYLDTNGQDFSPAMVAKIDQEILDRKIKEVEQSVRSKVEAENRYKAENARVFNETVAELGEAGRELSNPQSPLYQLANRKYAEMIRDYGKETVERVPHLQRLAILDAYQRIQAEVAGLEAPKPNGQPRGRLQAKEQLAAQSEAAVGDVNEVKARLAKRDVKGALAALPILRGMAEDISDMRRR